MAPAAANGANEAANRLFLEGKITFTQIGELVNAAMNNQKDVFSYTVDDVLEADFIARSYVNSMII